MMDRREFAASLPALLALAGVAEGQVGAKPKVELKTLTSGTFKPGATPAPSPAATGTPGRLSHPYIRGMLKAGNIQVEMHQTIQQPRAVHEAVGTHLHNEIWCVQRGVATLYINGTEHRMEAGDIGLVCAGDQHWIGNAGDSELAYFVITVGPPE